MEKASPYLSKIAILMGSKPNLRTHRKIWQIVNVHVSLRLLTPPIDPTSLPSLDAKNELFSESIRLRDRKEQGRERVDNLCPVSQGLPVPARACMPEILDRGNHSPVCKKDPFVASTARLRSS